MGNRRKYLIVAAAALAIVLAVGAAGTALAFGPWGQGNAVAQAQTPNGDQGQSFSCPLAGDPETVQAMQDAMKNGDFDKMRELMAANPSACGGNAEAMGKMMGGANAEQMQEWMRTGDYDAMRSFMQQQGVQPGQMMGAGHMCGGGQANGQTGMMGGANGRGMMGGAQFGGMMGGR